MVRGTFTKASLGGHPADPGSPDPPEQRDAQKDMTSPPTLGRGQNMHGLFLRGSLAADQGVITLPPHRRAQTLWQGGAAVAVEETIPKIPVQNPPHEIFRLLCTIPPLLLSKAP